MNNNQNIQIKTLEEISQQKEILREELAVHEQRMAEIWHETFREPTPQEKASPTQRAIAWMTTSAGLIDGAILGWKIYRRFGTAIKPFRRKKK